MDFRTNASIRGKSYKWRNSEVFYFFWFEEGEKTYVCLIIWCSNYDVWLLTFDVIWYFLKFNNVMESGSVLDVLWFVTRQETAGSQAVERRDKQHQ